MLTGLVLTVALSLLALLAGSALTGVGVAAAGRLLDLLGIKRRRQMATLALACIPLVSIVAR